jgi:DNA gyrase subunit B
MPEGGTHLTGLRMALTRMINQQAEKTSYLKLEEKKFSGQHVRQGLTAVVSIKHPDPVYEGAVRWKLMNPEATGIVASAVSDVFTAYLENNPADARRIFDHIHQAAKGG